MRVALLHDVTRAVCQAGHHRVAALWQRLLAPSFTALGHTLHCPEPFAADRPEPVAALMRRAGLAPEPAEWARLYSDPALLPEVVALLDGVEADMVLGWELSPNLVRALLARGVKVLDMSLAPLRFAPDLFLRLRASQPEWHEALAAMAVPAGMLTQAARQVREAAAPPHASGEAVVFIGQTDLDASLIEGGRLASVAHHLAALERLVAGRTLLLKPHPHGERHADVRLLHRHFPQAQLVTASAYTLIADPAIRTVVTLSSSVAQEASWFGRKAMALIRPDGDHLPELSPFHILQAHVTVPVFWANVLHAAMAPLPFTPALSLRGMFSLSWGWPPASPSPVPRLGAEWLAVASGQPGEALLRFGWALPDGTGARMALPLATLAVRTDEPGMLDLACCATGTSDPLPVALGLRPGGVRVDATLPPNQPTILRLPVAAAMEEGELALHLPEATSASVVVTGLRLIPPSG